MDLFNYETLRALRNKDSVGYMRSSLRLTSLITHLESVLTNSLNKVLLNESRGHKMVLVDL